MINKIAYTLVVLTLLSLVLFDPAEAQGGYDPSYQTPELLYDEARTVYLGNLARRDNGVPPLRWNLQLTHAARWFSWDSTENRPAGFCGHDDSQGHPFWYRTQVFGYLGFANAENAFCGYVTPEYAIQGWMNSPGHHDNLLNTSSREIGLGYYRRNSDGRGYVTQDFGSDDVYAPVIIEHEAVSTTSPGVNLYIYDRSTGGGFAGLAPASQMMISNNSQFCGAAWEPYNPNKAWTLAGGEGWRKVYVKTRDAFNRSMTVSDSIYLGSSLPLNELGPAQLSTTQSQVTMYGLNGGPYPQVQFSLGWMADDTFGTFEKWWGNGERVNDAGAWGGTAFRLSPGDGESFAWVYDTAFIKDTPMVAYFRLKINDNTSTGEVARISVKGGGTEYGPLSLHGTDFASANQYQEFAIPFTFNSNPDDAFLFFNFWRSGNADLYVDAVTIFSAPQPVTSPLTWQVPGGNYRGQGVWVRYANGSQFSALSEAAASMEPSYTISGNAGAAGATLRYSNACGTQTATAEGSGNYSFTVPAGWAGTITPYRKGYLFTPTSRAYSSVQGDQASQNYTAQACASCVDVNAWVGGNLMWSYTLNASQSTRDSYTGVDSGPVKVVNTTGTPIIASERINLKRNGAFSSYAEVMGLPASKLSDTYLFPWYNNTGLLDSQLRFGNVGTETTTVTIRIGGVTQSQSYILAPNESTRVSLSLDSGPVEVKSSNGVPIIAALRINLKSNPSFSSYSEFLGISASNILATRYIFPWYNNTGLLDSQLRFGNVGTETTTVTVKIGGVVQPQTYSLDPNESTRVAFNLDSGPVEVFSSGGVPITAALRINLKNNTAFSSYTELMGMAGTSLTDTRYLFPWYNNTGLLDSQLRFGNVGNAATTVRIKVNGVLWPAAYTLDPSESTRVSLAGVNNGPVEVYSSGGVPIIAAMRINLKSNTAFSSYFEFMGSSVGAPLGLPGDQLSSTYWFPWYNNTGLLDSQLRFGVP